MAPKSAGAGVAGPLRRLSDRSCGALLHPTSLPGPGFCGNLGAAARDFVGWLQAAGLGWWQMLPIGPTGADGSPYCGVSAFAGNPLLIDFAALVRTARTRGNTSNRTNVERVDYRRAGRAAEHLRIGAFRQFQRDGQAQERCAAFAARESHWLADYALFSAIRDDCRGAPWTSWDAPLRIRKSSVLKAAAERLRERRDYHIFLQWAFEEQWQALRRYAAERGVALLGDIPIFVGHDSADVWSHQELFRLDRRGQPVVISGVPPDYFSRTGQLWGHPLYRWERHRAENYAWWRDRVRRTADQFDAARIDHFLGFHRCWATPFGDKTAVRGVWTASPGAELFRALRPEMSRVEIVAEDLGAVTPEAAALRDAFHFPGMRIFQFGFGVENTSHLPHHYPQRCVAYTGTHDNETVMGWFQRICWDAARGADGLTTRERVLRYCGATSRVVHRAMWRMLCASAANLVVAPVQDFLGLGNAARMNTPGIAKGNWAWRLPRRALSPQRAAELLQVAAAFERNSSP